MDYFNLFKKITIAGVQLTDISTLIKITSYLPDICVTYSIKDGETAYDISNSLYGTDEYYWSIYLANPSMMFDSLKTTEELSSYISANYDFSAVQIPAPLSSYTQLQSVTNPVYRLKDISTGTYYNIARWDGLRNIAISDTIIPADSSSVVVSCSFNGGEIIISGNHSLLRKMVAEYDVNGVKFYTLPTGTSFTSYTTFEDLENIENEKKRDILVVDSKYLQQLIDAIRTFNGT